MSQRHQDPMVANTIEVGKEILSKTNNLDRGDQRDLIQKNNMQQVKKKGKGNKGEDLMSFDSDDDTSYKKDPNIEALKLKPSLQEAKDLNKDSLSSPKLKAQKISRTQT